MTETSELERYIAWCRGEGLDGSRDYRALESVARFKRYEAHIAKEARQALIDRNVPEKNQSAGE